MRLERLARLAALLVAISAVWIPGPIALAQTPPAGSSEVGAPAAHPIPLEDVPARAEVTRAEISTLLPGDAPRQMLERIGSELDRTLPEVEVDDGHSTLSDLAVAVQEALAEAGIGVPFPQRDLHLVSVSPNAAAELERATTPSPQGGTVSDSHGRE